MSKGNKIKIYTDGSAVTRDSKTFLGIGWVMVTGQEEKEVCSEAVDISLPVEPGDANFILAAELIAATRGLNAAPEKSNILLKTDNLNVKAFLKGKPLLYPLEGIYLSVYFNNLREAVARHATVRVETANAKTNERMKKAHNLAGEASGASKRYILQTDWNPFSEGEKTELGDEGEGERITWPPKLPPDAFDH